MRTYLSACRLRTALPALATALFVLTGATLGGSGLPVPSIVQRGGVRVGLVRLAPASRPAPTLVFLATNIEHTFNATFGGVPELAYRAGWTVVTLDLPAHGDDRGDDEVPGAELWAWRARMLRGEDIIGPFTRRVSQAISGLIASGEADPQRVFIGGISRGGFMALHVAAADSRVVGTVAFMPVTELHALLEFHGAAVGADAALQAAARRLAGRPVWITVGTNDDRVDTAATLRFAKAVYLSSVRAGTPNRLELHVRGANGHAYPKDAEEQAAEWLFALADASR